MSIAAQCPNCGAPIEFHVSSSVVTVCEHCLAVVARTDRALESLGKTADLVKTRSPLTLWLGGKYQGVGFQLTGRAQLKHGAGGVWDEWYLAFDDGRWGWLAEAQGRFYLTFREPRAFAIDAQNLRPGLTVAAGDPPVYWTVAEVGEAEILAGRGEIPYDLRTGERYFYADMSAEDGSFATLDFGEQPPALFSGRQVTLDELGISRSEPEQEHDQVDAGVSVEALSCENCGGALELHAPELTERVACPYCGSMHDADHGVLNLVQTAKRKAIKPALPLGAKGIFEDETFTLIGFMRRSTRGEWGAAQWDEYLLYHPRAGFRWLVYSDGHWSYVTPLPVGAVVGGHPRGFHQRGDLAQYQDKDYKIFQTGKARVDYVAGEFYWRVEAGEVVDTVDYVAPPEMLSGEATSSEITWSLGTYMTRGEVDECFPDASPPAESVFTVAPNQPYRHTPVYRTWVILLALAVAAFLWAQGRSINRQVMFQTFDLPGQQQKSAEGELLFSEPFQLLGGHNIQVRGDSSTLDNSWMYVQADLYNEETGSVYAFDLPIEYYQGVSYGEHWSEGSRTKMRYLSAVPAGNYVLRLLVERSDFKKDAKLVISMRQGVFRWAYALLMFLGISLIPLGVFVHQRLFERRRWSLSDFAPGDDE